MFGVAVSMFEPEHRSLLRRGAEAFVNAIPLTEARRLRDASDFDRARIREIGDLGWLALCTSDDPEIGLHEMVAVHRALGRGVLLEPLVATGVLSPMLAAGGSTETAQKLVEALRSGTSVVTAAWQAGPGALNSDGLGVRATRTKNGWQLTGHAAYVPWANKVDQLLVSARTDDGEIIVVLPSHAEGIAVSQALAVDKTMFCDVRFDHCIASDAALVVQAQHGAKILDEALDVARLALSAELVGMSERLFHITLDYLKQRRQFGRTLGSNQALQFIAVDLFTQIELANSVLRDTCDRMTDATDSVQSARAAAGCKIRANDVALMTAKQAIQLHGAIGYTDGCDVSLFVKRAFTGAAWLGTSSLLRTRLAELHISGDPITVQASSLQ